MRSFNQVQQTVSPSLKDIPSDVLDFLGTLDDNQGRIGNRIFKNVINSIVHQTTFVSLVNVSLRFELESL